MMMKIDNGVVFLKDPSPAQRAAIKCWNSMKWDRKNMWWYGLLSLDLLNHIADITKLPESVKTIREQMVQVQQAVDYERTLPADQLQPLAKFPVTKSLYSHQVRACNMALLTFGVLDPKEVAG